MARRILNVHAGHASVSDETGFDSERELEVAIASHPEALPCEDMGLGSLVALGSQLDFGSGPMDLLAVDADGRLAIIEFKRGTENRDVRKVVAQLLDYGSALWRTSYAELAGACGADTGAAALDALVARRCIALGIPFDAATFRAGLERTLETGTFVFLYVGRDLDERSRRIMTYLAEGPQMAFFAVEVDHYRDPEQDRAVLVLRASFIPSWISGPPAASRSPGRVSASLASASPETLRLVELMDAVAHDLGLVVKRSRTGRNYEPPVQHPGARYNSGIGVYASSRGMELNLQIFRDFDADDIADDLLDRLREVTGTGAHASNWPAVPCNLIVSSWEQARGRLVEPYFQAREQLGEGAA